MNVKMVVKKVDDDSYAVFFCKEGKEITIIGEIVGSYNAKMLPKDCPKQRLDMAIPYCEGIYAKNLIPKLINEFCDTMKIQIDMIQFNQKFEVYADNCDAHVTIEDNKGKFTTAFLDRYTKWLDMFGIDYRITDV